MNQLNNLNLVNIFVLCWKDSNSTYFPSGVQRTINCRHQNEGLYSVNTRGKVTPLPNTSVVLPPVSSVPTDYQAEQGYVQPGQAFGGVAPVGGIVGPFAYSADVHICYKIKDLTTQITYYCDVADYNNKIVGCNLVQNH